MEITMIMSYQKFMVFLLILMMNFNRSNTGTLKESLTNVRAYFKAISKKGYWIGTISLIAIFALVEVDILMRIGGITNMNFSISGSYVFESYFSIFLIILIISIPFIVRKDTQKYTSVLHDLDQTIEELNEEE